jgi:hypothetical protein
VPRFEDNRARTLHTLTEDHDWPTVAPNADTTWVMIELDNARVTERGQITPGTYFLIYEHDGSARSIGPDTHYPEVLHKAFEREMRKINGAPAAGRRANIRRRNRA